MVNKCNFICFIYNNTVFNTAQIEFVFTTC